MHVIKKCEIGECSEETGFKCVFKQKVPCCGNDVCETGEEGGSCDDCEYTTSLEDVKEEVKRLYKFPSSSFMPASEEGYMYHTNNVINANIIELTTAEEYLNDFTLFDSYVMNFVNSKYKENKEFAGKKVQSNGYDRYEEDLHKEILEFNQNKVIFSLQVLKFFSIESKKDKYEELESDGYFYILCTPNQVIELERDPNVKFVTNFENDDLEKLNEAVESYKTNLKLRTENYAKQLSEFCQQ